MDDCRFELTPGFFHKYLIAEVFAFASSREQALRLFWLSSRGTRQFLLKNLYLMDLYWVHKEEDMLYLDDKDWNLNKHTQHLLLMSDDKQSQVTANLSTHA